MNKKQNLKLSVNFNFTETILICLLNEIIKLLVIEGYPPYFFFLGFLAYFF